MGGRSWAEFVKAEAPRSGTHTSSQSGSSDLGDSHSTSTFTPAEGTPRTELQLK